MEEQVEYKAIYIATRHLCDMLETRELLGLNLTVVLGEDPRKLPCYDKISGLFQEEYEPPKMHELVRQVLVVLVTERMKGL